MSHFFTSLGRFIVRFRYLIVVAWIVGHRSRRPVPAVAERRGQGHHQRLPAGELPEHAGGHPGGPVPERLARVGDAGRRPRRRADRRRQRGDRPRSRRRSAGVDRVKLVVDLGVSGDGQARQALSRRRSSPSAAGPRRRAWSTRSARPSPRLAPRPVCRSTSPASWPPRSTPIAASGSSQDQTQLLSLLFIIVLLLLAFRAVLAPLVTLIPAAFVLVLSGPVIAESTKIGVQVSSITQLLLIVLILGAGTDYGVFLVFRVREELRRGLTPHEAVIRSVSRVGRVDHLLRVHRHRRAGEPRASPSSPSTRASGRRSPSASPSCCWPGLTLLPALLAIFGRAVFWPTGAAIARSDRPGLWDRIGVIATRRPGVTLAAGLALFGGLGATLLTTGVAGFGDVELEPRAAPTPAAGTALIAGPLPLRRTPAAARSSCSSRPRSGTTRRSSPTPRRASPACRSSAASSARSTPTASR